jgi:hypothetical protein
LFRAAANMIGARCTNVNTSHGDEAASRLAPKGGDGRFDLYVVMNGRDGCRDFE